LLDEHTQGLHVATSPGAGSTRLTLVAEPGTQINARLKPALELRGGAVLRFDSPHLTADSAYFADAPDAFAPAGASLKGAILRASVCSKGERVWSRRDRKSTRLNSSHVSISYAVFCLKKKKAEQGRVTDGGG